MSQELLGSEITQGLVGTEGVVGPFPGLELVIELGDRERAEGDLIEFLRMGAIGALHLAVELGRARGKHKEAQAPLLTSFLEESGKLTTAIDLQSAQGKGQPTLQGIREQVAAVEVARRCTSITSQREIMSRAVNCFRTRLGEGRKSSVSSCTRSPGFSAA